MKYVLGGADSVEPWGCEMLVEGICAWYVEELCKVDGRKWWELTRYDHASVGEISE